MDEFDPARELLGIVRAHRLTDIVAAAVRLGLADAIGDGSEDPESLAEKTGTHAPTLYRLLRGLASAGVLHEGDDRHFSLTPMGALLRTDAPASLRDWVSLVDKPYTREAWANLDRSVRTGEIAFTSLHGEDIWQWRRHEPGESAIFNRAMAAISRGVGPALADGFDFGNVETLADIGGGSGTILAAILARHPRLRGVLFDQAHVVPEAAQVLAAAGVADRCEVVGGDFFQGVPQGADAYLLKAILHDWEDAEATTILRNIRSAMSDSGRLLVVERVIGPPNEDLDGALSDLHMLVMPGGRERTTDEWAELLRAGGFELAEIRPLVLGWELLVGMPGR